LASGKSELEKPGLEKSVLGKLGVAGFEKFEADEPVSEYGGSGKLDPA
jgi:hypothetical protein